MMVVCYVCVAVYDGGFDVVFCVDYGTYNCCCAIASIVVVVVVVLW